MHEPETRGRVVRILVADDRGDMRKLLRSLLEFSDDLVVVGEAGNGVEALQMVECLRPDVAILDVRMPLKDGIETARDLRELHPEVLVMAVSLHSDGKLVKAMRDAGARAYVLKGTPGEVLRQAVQAVANGEEYFPEDREGGGPAQKGESTAYPALGARALGARQTRR